MLISFIDTTVILLYLLIVLFVGFRFAARQKSPEMFMVAKRSLPGWLIGFSLFATNFSNVTLISTTGRVYSENWAILAKFMAFPIAIACASLFFASFYKKSNYISAYSHLEERFGVWASCYGALFYICLELFRMGVVIYLVAIALSSIFRISEYQMIAITGAVVILYTYMGGLEAVIWTDFFQGVIFFIGVLFSIAYLAFHMPEGYAQILSIANVHNKLSLGDFSFNLKEESFWVFFVLGITLYLQDFGINHTFVQRYFASASVKELQKGLWVNFFLSVAFMLMVFFLGTCLFAFYKANELDMLSENVVLTNFIVSHLPNGLSGLLIVGILAAAMSSIDSSLNGIATVFYVNFYKRFRKNDLPLPKAKGMKVLHLASSISGLLAIALAASMVQVKSVWNTWYAIATMINGAILGLYLLGILSKYTNPSIGFISVLIGVSSIIWMLLSPEISTLPPYLKYPFHGFLIGTFGTLVILFVGLVLPKLFSKYIFLKK